MRDRTGRVAGWLSCGPLCIPVFPLGEKQPGPILCQTAWIGKSTGEISIVLSSGSEFQGHAAKIRRHKILERYGVRLDGLYKGPETSKKLLLR